MISYGGKIIGAALAIGGKMASTIAYGGKIIWQAIKSCFGKGFWRDDFPWDDNEGWRD